MLCARIWEALQSVNSLVDIVASLTFYSAPRRAAQRKISSSDLSYEVEQEAWDKKAGNETGSRIMQTKLQSHFAADLSALPKTEKRGSS